MERKLVQVSDQEIRIDFALNSKCRANVCLTSLTAASAVAFKVQTSSPEKFLVKPPTGIIPPLCQVTFQVILKPQADLPPQFPRSPTDRFLIRAAEFAGDSSPESARPESINRCFANGSTHDIKLKVAFVGPLLLRRAVGCGDYDAVRNIIRRQRTILAELPPREAESLLRIATELGDPEDMINLLLEAGLRIGGVDCEWGSNGLDEVHVAETCGRYDHVVGLNESGSFKCKDEGKIRCANVLELGKSLGADPTFTTDQLRPLHGIACHKDKLEMGEQVLMAARRGDLRHIDFMLQNGAEIDCCDQYGLRALHAAAIKGHKDVALKLIEFGMGLECLDSEGHTPLHLAVVGGSLEVVQMLVQNGANVNAKSNAGATPLYMATAMGYNEITKFLISRGV